MNSILLLHSGWNSAVSKKGCKGDGCEKNWEKIKNKAIPENVEFQSLNAHKVYSSSSYTAIYNILSRYNADFDLKKIIDDNSLLLENRGDAKKAIKKIFEDKYKNQSVNKTDKKAAGVQYFFNKLRF